jgi:hypothetical protein
MRMRRRLLLGRLLLLRVLGRLPLVLDQIFCPLDRRNLPARHSFGFHRIGPVAIKTLELALSLPIER